MRKLILNILLVFTFASSSIVNAQFNNRNRMDKLEGFDQQKFSWGFYLGSSVFDYKIVLDPRYGMYADKNLVSSSPSVSFSAGLIGRMRINDNLDLRIEPGLQFMERELQFNTQSNDRFSAGTLTNPAFTPFTLQEKDKVRNLKQTLLDVPVLIELHGDRWYNSRPYFATGLNYILNLQSQANNPDDNLKGTFRSTSHNFAWSAEMGIQIYFNRFKLTPGIRGTFFMNNELVADNINTPPYWSKAISTISSRAFMFVLKFE